MRGERWKRIIFGLMAFALTGTLNIAIAGFDPVVAPARAQPPDRVSLIRKGFDAFNRHDVNVLLAMYADSALFVGGAPCLPAAPCLGKAAFRKAFEAGAAAHASITVLNTLMRGSVVTGRFELRADGIRAKGVDRIIDVFLAEIPKDLVTVWVAVPDFTDPDTAKFFGVR